MRLFLKIILLAFASLLASLYFISSKILNEHTSEIEKLIYNQTSINTKIDTLSLSFLSLKAKKLELSNNNLDIKIDELNITPNSYLSILGDFLTGELNLENKFIKKIKAKNIKITIKNINLDTQSLSEDKTYAELLNFIKPIELIDIQDIQLNNVRLKDTKFMYGDKFFHIETEMSYLDNKIRFGGTFDLINFIQSGKINTELKGNLKNINLAYISKIIANNNIKIDSGNLNGDFQISIIDNKINLNSQFSLNNTIASIWDKKFILKPILLEGTLKDNNLIFILSNKPILNDTELDINEVFISFNQDYHPEKLLLKSSILNYSGYFSENFLTNENKHIKFDFNLIDLSYFNKLKVLDIPKPLSESLAENGEGIIEFKKKNKKYEISYNVKAKTSLILDNVKLESDAVIQNNNLIFEHFIVNGERKKSQLKYNLINDDFRFTLNDSIDNKIYSIADNLFNLDIGVKSFSNHPNLNLTLNRINRNYYYNGHLTFKDNTIQYKYYDSDFTLDNLKGNLYFTKSGITNSDLFSNSIRHNDIVLINTNLKLKHEGEHFNLKLNNLDIFGEIDYQEKTDDLRIYIDNLNYKLTKEEAKKIIQDNKASIDKIKSIVLPKKLFVKLANLKISGKNLGNFEIFSNKNSGVYGILTKFNSPYWEGTVSSNLNKDNDLSSNFEITVKDPQLLSETLEIKKILKDAVVFLKGKVSTNLNSLDYGYIISNMNGDISLESKNGEFIDVNTGAGTMLSLLNFRTIPDIVTLDFKNVFNNKLQFDKIKSTIDIKNGIFSISNGNIKSKISDIMFNGNINILKEELNLNLEMTPKISNSILFTTVSIATGFNPITMLGSSIIEKIIPMPNILKYKYKINGTFEEPNIKKL